MTDTVTKEDVAKPPYISFGTFTNFLDRLGAGAMPPVIDKGYLDTMSGGTQAMLMQTLRAMNFVDDNGTVRPALAQAATDPDARKRHLKAYFDFAYVEQQELAAKNGTSTQLATSFAKYKYTGSTLRKAIVFYLAMVDYLEATKSPNFKPPRATPSTGRRRPNRDQSGDGDDEEDDDDPPPPKHTGEVVIVNLGDAGKVTLDVDVRWLELDDEVFVELRKLVKDMQALAVQAGGNPGDTSSAADEHEADTS